MTERPLTQHIPADGSLLSLKEYEKVGGYEALRKAVSTMAPADVTNVVKDAKLLGRGGAGFPTGTKWSLVPMGEAARRPKYVVANADEMEPGTFKDRWLLECHPHQLIEGMALAAYAIEAEIGYIFMRDEYSLAAQRVRQAFAEALEAGYLGKNILGSGFSLDLRLHLSAGRYICGEETALLNALEGRRAVPRSKPPFPATVGLWGKPTVVNNVETYSNIPHIIAKGAEWYQRLSFSPGEGGTKIYGVSGRVRKPGLWELPLGTPLREILDGHAGGMQEGYGFRGVIPGGASTDFLVAEHLDIRMDYASVSKAGSRLGTGTMIVLDDKTCPVGMVCSLTRFFARESCGWCTPCREGLPWALEILEAIEKGTGQRDDLDTLAMLTRFMGPGNTFCALAPGAAEPIQSALKYFREDFVRHIETKRCPWR